MPEKVVSTGRLRKSAIAVEGSCTLHAVTLRGDGTNAVSCVIHDGLNAGTDSDAKIETNIFAGGFVAGRDQIGLRMQKGIFVELIFSAGNPYAIIEYSK